MYIAATVRLTNTKPTKIIIMILTHADGNHQQPKSLIAIHDDSDATIISDPSQSLGKHFAFTVCFL